MPVLDANALIGQRVDAIRNFHASVGLNRAELDLSGGVDSAVMAGLLTEALGADRLVAVYSSINSGGESQVRACALADELGLNLVVHDLTPTYEAMISDMVDNLESVGHDRSEIEARIASDPTILGSIRSCLRAPLGRGFLRLTGNGIRHGTGNECEDRWLRFYQKGGDGEVDTNPVAMLSKGEVFQLARALGQHHGAEASYRAIGIAAPTPELWGEAAAHTDEDEIGTYLGLSDTGHTFYSYVDPDTGDYVRTGLIERVARFADTAHGAGLFHDASSAESLDSIIQAAVTAPAFAGVNPTTAVSILLAARRTERITRHKFNPSCPTLGNRSDLLEAGILSNLLPPM